MKVISTCKQIPVIGLLFAALVCVSVSADDNGDEIGALVEVRKWETRSWGDYPGHANHERQIITFTLDSGMIGYAIQYSYCADPSHAPDVATPEGYIGMPQPSWENWYGNGFLYIIVNDRDIGLTRPSVIRKLEDAERGSVQIVWDRNDAQVRLTFMVLPKETALLIEVAVFPKTEFRSLSLTLVAYPAAYTTQGQRCLVTPKRKVTQVQTVEISPQEEWWLLYQDNKFDKAKGHTVGGCGAVFLTEEVESGKVSVEAYPIVTELRCKAGISRVHFAVWDFCDKTNAEAEAFIKANAHRVAKLLRRIDFTCRHLRKEEWSKLRATVTELLPYAKRNPDLFEKASALVREVDEAHNRITEFVSKGQIAPPELENTILANLEKLEPLMWELRFEKLFSENEHD